MTIELIVGEDPRIEVIEVRSIGLDPGGNIGTKKLDDLTDVMGADAGLEGQVLTKDADGQWKPMASTGGGGGDPGPQSYIHEQITPATVWIISHGLSFNPSGVEVRDHVGQPHYPIVSWPNGISVRLDFDYDVRGTARLS
jgi:hypothetical protein